MENALKLPARIRALIYDFDNTIVSTETMNEGLFGEVLRTGFDTPLDADEQEIISGLPWSGVFEWLAAHRGLRGRRAEIWRRFMEVKREALKAKPPQIATGLDRLLSLPVEHAIVTGSTREELEIIMETVGLSQGLFTAILCDEDCARGKPDPEGYLRAVELLGVPRGEALVFEDSVPGITAARKAGITVAFVSEFAAKDRSKLADVRFRDMEDAWQAVRNLAVVL